MQREKEVISVVGGLLAACATGAFLPSPWGAGARQALTGASENTLLTDALIPAGMVLVGTSITYVMVSALERYSYYRCRVNTMQEMITLRQAREAERILGRKPITLREYRDTAAQKQLALFTQRLEEAHTV